MNSLNWKIEKIKSLNDEVKELHPLLKSLFEKMPTIRSVLYTQGNRENGADFILTRTDNLLDQDEYVGVVVKSAQIRQNSDDVHRQIKECIALSRPVENGKKFIYLTEVWVVTNHDITRNAEDHLNAEYRSTKIKFIDGEIIVKLIDKYFDSYWKISNISVNKYIQEQLRILNSSINLHRLLPPEFGRITVERDIITNSPEIKRRFNAKKARATSLWDEIHKKKLIFLEGRMGSGKSELLRSTAIKLCENALHDSASYVPYFINFRDLAKLIATSPEAFVENIHKEVGDSGRQIVIFVDGLDESSEENETKVPKICSLASIIHGRDDTSLVVASRVIDEEELSSNIASCFDKYLVSPLAYGTIVKFVERICDSRDVSTKLRDDLQRSPLMRALPRTPLSAILLGKLLKENINELPATLPELYSKYVELVLGRWDLEKNGGSEKEYETIQRLTSMIATYFLDNDLDSLGLVELKAMFQSYLQDRRTGQSLEPMLQMFLRKSELISFNEEEQVVNFRHKSFAEFFYAHALLMEQGKNATLPKPFSTNWSGIEYFYLGLIRDAPERLKQLSSLQPSDASEDFIKFSQFGNFMMAAYQTPYEVIKTALYDRFVEAAKQYSSIVQKRSNSFFTKFPELQVLSIFTHLIRRGYSYEFFRPALQEARIQFELDSGLSDDERIVAIFFVDSILCELKDESAFEALVDRHEASIGWTIRLGICHASADAAFVNRTTKSVARKIEKSLKGNQTLMRYLQTIESTPISERKD